MTRSAYPPRQPRRRRPGGRTLVLLGAVALALGASVLVIAGYRLHTQHQTATVGTGATTPSASGSPSPSASADCATATLAKLDVPHQVGQLLMIGTPIADPAALAGAVAQYHLGGVFLAGRSKASSATLLAAVQKLRQAAATDPGVPLQIALDQEGGEVQTLSGPDFPTIPTALVQGTWSSQQLHDRTVDAAKRLAAAGITMDLAPVADTVPAGTAGSNPPIGQLDRQFGSDPVAVAADIATVVAAAQSAGVVTTLKHFPGLGRVRSNTDTSTAAVDNTTTAQDPYLKPFSAGIQAGTGAVMVSSAKYPKLDSQNIAAFSSPIITGLLRQQLGFTGVVISDDLGAAVAVKAVAIGDRAVRFVTAGGDVVLTVRPSDAGPMSSALIAAAQEDPAFAARVRDAAGHVIAGKVRAGLLHC